ncbi:hypothetical protein G5714_012070 [Onychostoma macrolepis]|uniref:Uncharacterized protein n=1 Tax=Onychostoma macrolepis TaxID=369639 RepID=A0A7J6CKM1_9TELE|nr:hypothetical protein G5714_012070 [Onychostoma macrolepis]
MLYCGVYTTAALFIASPAPCPLASVQSDLPLERGSHPALSPALQQHSKLISNATVLLSPLVEWKQTVFDSVQLSGLLHCVAHQVAVILRSGRDHSQREDGTRQTDKEKHPPFVQSFELDLTLHYLGWRRFGPHDTAGQSTPVHSETCDRNEINRGAEKLRMAKPLVQTSGPNASPHSKMKLWKFAAIGLILCGAALPLLVLKTTPSSRAPPLLPTAELHPHHFHLHHLHLHQAIHRPPLWQVAGNGGPDQLTEETLSYQNIAFSTQASQMSGSRPTSLE